MIARYPVSIVLAIGTVDDPAGELFAKSSTCAQCRMPTTRDGRALALISNRGIATGAPQVVGEFLQFHQLFESLSDGER